MPSIALQEDTWSLSFKNENEMPTQQGGEQCPLQVSVGSVQPPVWNFIFSEGSPTRNIQKETPPEGPASSQPDPIWGYRQAPPASIPPPGRARTPQPLSVCRGLAGSPEWKSSVGWTSSGTRREGSQAWSMHCPQHTCTHKYTHLHMHRHTKHTHTPLYESSWGSGLKSV